MEHSVKLWNLLFLIIIIMASSAESQQGTQNQLAVQQLQIIELLDNFNCFRNDQQNVEDTGNSFDPLDNLDLYTNPDVVETFFTNLNAGLYLSRTAPFDVGGSDLTQYLQFFDILYFNVDNWQLLYNTTAYSIKKGVNTAFMLWAYMSLLSTAYKGFKQPPPPEVFPQFYTPKWIVRNGNGEDGGDGENDIDPTDPENRLSYFRHDPALNTFHFRYMHHNLVNRYKAERLAANLPEVFAINITEPISPGDIPITLNVNYREFPTRQNNTIIQDTIFAEEIDTLQSRIQTAINQGYFVDTDGRKINIRNFNGSNVLGAAIESSTESPDRDYYGVLHNDLHQIVAEINNPYGDLDLPPGVLIHQETAVQDPVFFRIHQLIDDYNKLEKYKLRPYTKRDITTSDIEIASVNIATGPVITTFFEDFTYDISNAIKSCAKVNSGGNFTATVRRLNHDPFDYRIIAVSRRPGNTRGIVRIYMSPVIGYNGKPYTDEELYWNMFEMDRFPITLTQGQNEIKRSSRQSAVTIPDRPGFKALLKEAKKSTSANATSGPPYSNTRQCGYPNHLLVPKGTILGMKFKMFVIITGTYTGDYDEKDYPSLPYCGNPRGPFPDGRSMGFPFDQKVDFGRSLFPGRENYKFLDVIVRHKQEYVIPSKKLV